MRVQGDRFTIKAGAQVLGEVTDAFLSEGSFGVVKQGSFPSTVNALRFLDLDSPTPPLKGAAVGRSS